MPFIDNQSTRRNEQDAAQQRDERIETLLHNRTDQMSWKKTSSISKQLKIDKSLYIISILTDQQHGADNSEATNGAVHDQRIVAEVNAHNLAEHNAANGKALRISITITID